MRWDRKQMLAVLFLCGGGGGSDCVVGGCVVGGRGGGGYVVGGRVVGGFRGFGGAVAAVGVVFPGGDIPVRRKRF